MQTTTQSLAIPEHITDHTEIAKHLWNSMAATVKEREFGKTHDVYQGAPTLWAAERGATHTVWCGIGPGRGVRPAILKKTVLLVGIDEVDDKIIWEKWNIKTIFCDFV